MIISDQAVSVGFGAAIGAGITGLFLVLNQLLNRRHEERKHRRELATNAALEYWKAALEFTQTQPGQYALSPLTAYMVFMDRALKLIEKTPPLTDAELEKEVESLLITVKRIHDTADRVGGGKTG